MIYVVIVLAVIIFILLALFLMAFLVNGAAFGRRCDKNPLLTYFTAEDFSLSAQTVEIPFKKGEVLRAVIYKKEGVPQKQNLIIFCHGMGPGHIAYTTEIAYFCGLGYTVLAPDYYGCNLSDGKKITSFDMGSASVERAIDYARENMPGYGGIYLVGHSWGGWTAICAGYAKQVDKIVAISAPDRPDRAILTAASSRLPKFIVVLLKPFIRLVCGDKSAAKLVQKCRCPVLLVQGGLDKTVPSQNAVFSLVVGRHITKYLAKGKGHNPYNTTAAEERLSKLSQGLADVKNTGEEFFKQFDYKAATEEDEFVMGEIARFLS